PFGGCLPMLLQLPIFIAFYQTLMNMVELKGASFILWMQDLSRPDPFYILPFIMGGSMFIQQKMSQAATPTVDAAQASQQKIFLYGLPIFLTFLALNWPSGLLLYWSVSNVLGIAQQFFVNKSKD
ncbi:MAG TPA: membrane protein insertase YidC, partial [Firmicutes bacterium]|nr:membrane protein insertase YidC [Bacillota bacterium]